MAPSPARRAASITARDGRAALVAGGFDERVTPPLHHTFADGSAAFLLPDDHPLHALVDQAPRGELPVMLELTDLAPIALREPVRGLLWISGWLRALDPGQARYVALQMAAARPEEALLDLGHGAGLLWLHPASAVLADSDGTASLAPDELGAAEPDPLCLLEGQWLAHLEQTHPEVLGALARRLPPDLRADTGQVRPLGVDRLGMQLRLELASADHDVRLAFSRPVQTPVQLAVEVQRLVGCPARLRQSGLRPAPGPRPGR